MWQMVRSFSCFRRIALLQQMEHTMDWREMRKKQTSKGTIAIGFIFIFITSCYHRYQLPNRVTTVKLEEKRRV